MAARPSGSVDYTQWMRGRGCTTFNVQQLQQSVRTSRVYLSSVNPHACVVRAASRSAALFGATCESPSRAALCILFHPCSVCLCVCDPAILMALSTPPPSLPHTERSHCLTVVIPDVHICGDTFQSCAGMAWESFPTWSPGFSPWPARPALCL